MEEIMIRKELEKLFGSFCKTAEGFFYSEEEVQFLIFIFYVKNNRIAGDPVIPLTEDRDKISRLVQQRCRERNAVAGIIVGEAWIVRPKKDEIVLNGIVPSKRPDRIEVLNVILVSKILNKGRVWKIIRDGKKHLEPLGDGDLNPIYSKFFGDYFNVDVPKSEGKEMKN